MADTQAALERRRSTQPYHLPSCGSVFRNPTPYKAGWLIEQTGLKGHQIGQAQVSTLHANFIVNLGGAQAQDILALIQDVQARVAAAWDVSLHPEVRLLGRFEELPT
jgi:UDP-N-acetylmuramate dehydrogenase